MFPMNVHYFVIIIYGCMLLSLNNCILYKICITLVNLKGSPIKSRYEVFWARVKYFIIPYCYNNVALKYKYGLITVCSGYGHE